MAEFFLRRMSTALSMLPSASVRAALQSIMGALVRSRRVFTAAAEIVLIDLSCPKKGVWNFQALQTPFLDKASIKDRGEARASLWAWASPRDRPNLQKGDRTRKSAFCV